MRVIWSTLALERVESIARTIADDRPGAAQKWVRQVFARVAQLARYPESGPMVPELTRPEVRQLPYPPYRIVYKVEANRVVILTIRHGREQLDTEGELGASE